MRGKPKKKVKPVSRNKPVDSLRFLPLEKKTVEAHWFKDNTKMKGIA